MRRDLRLGGIDPADQRGGNPTVHRYPFRREMPRQDLPVAAEPGQESAVARIGFDVQIAEASPKAVARRSGKGREAVAGTRRDADGMRIPRQQTVAVGLVGESIDLVKDEEGVFVFNTQLRQHVANGRNLGVNQRARGVGHMEE